MGRFGQLSELFPDRTLEFPQDLDIASAPKCEGDYHMPIPVELRRAKRYRLAAPTLFLWAPQDGESHRGEGETRDINTFGIYVLTDSLPPIGARVQLETILPTLTDTGSGMLLQG